MAARCFDPAATTPLPMRPTLASLALAALLAVSPGLASAQALGSFDCIARAAAPCAPGGTLSGLAVEGADPPWATDRQRGLSFEAARSGASLSLSAAPPQEVATLADAGPPSSVPEPRAYALTLAGLAALGFMARRRRG